MIDTISIYTTISSTIYNKIYNNSTIKSSHSNETGEIFYKIINSHLEGSYSSSLSVRVDYCLEGYKIKIEGSYHKIKLGYNSHNGFCNLNYIANNLIGMVEDYYKIELPQLEYWYISRVDIAICYDLENQNNIAQYINNLKNCTFPKRKVNFYKNESLYSSGSSTTIKIYNKLKEFNKHDKKKFINTNFNLLDYINNIKGYLRFECEIKKRKLLKIYNKEKHIKVIDIKYNELKKVWREEFVKLIKLSENEMIKLNEKEKVKLYLEYYYTKIKARNLYNFYLSILVDGLDKVKSNISKTAYYKNLKELKALNIDFSQTYNIEFSNTYIDFNPFLAKEVV